MAFFRRGKDRVQPWKPTAPISTLPDTPEPPKPEPEPEPEETEEALKERLERERRAGIMATEDLHYKKNVFEHFNEFRGQFSKEHFFVQDVDAYWNGDRLLPSVGHAILPLIRQIDDKRYGLVIDDLEATIGQLEGSLTILVPHFNGDFSKYREVNPLTKKCIEEIPDRPEGLLTKSIYDRKTRKYVQVRARANRVGMSVEQEIVLELKPSTSEYSFMSTSKRRDGGEETLHFFCDIYCYEIEFIIEEEMGFTKEDGPERALLGDMFEEIINREMGLGFIGYEREFYEIKLEWQNAPVILRIMPSPKNNLFNIEPTFIPGHLLQPNTFLLFPGLEVTHTHSEKNVYVNHCRFIQKKD